MRTTSHPIVLKKALRERSGRSGREVGHTSNDLLEGEERAVRSGSPMPPPYSRRYRLPLFSTRCEHVQVSLTCAELLSAMRAAFVLTTNKKPNKLDPTYPAASVNSAELDQKSCEYVGIAYGSRGTRGNVRMRPRIRVAPPSLGSIQMETTWPPHRRPATRWQSS